MSEMIANPRDMCASGVYDPNDDLLLAGVNDRDNYCTYQTMPPRPQIPSEAGKAGRAAGRSRAHLHELRSETAHEHSRAA
jgi:hypothetical protein